MRYKALHYTTLSMLMMSIGLAHAQEQQAEARVEISDQPISLPPLYMQQNPVISLPPNAVKKDDRNYMYRQELGANVSPEEIRRIKQIIEAQERAMIEQKPPQMLTRTIRVSADPGAQVPTVDIVPGFVTTIIFTDSHGQPWPVVGHTVGNDRDFKTTAYPVKDRPEMAHVLTISTTYPWISTSVSVSLEGLTVPITIMAKTNQAKSDGRIDMQVSGVGPNSSNIKKTNDIPSSVSDKTMMDFVDGVVPSSAKEVGLSNPGDNMRAWMYNGHLYVRARYVISSPGWLEKTTGVGGVNVYKMKPTSVILYARNGNIEMTQVDNSVISGMVKK